MDDLLEKLNIYTKQPVNDPRIIWLLIGIGYHYIEDNGVEGILSFEAEQYGCIAAMAKAFMQLLTNVSSNNLFNIKKSATLEQQKICVQKIESRLLNFHKLCTESLVRARDGITSDEYRTADFHHYELHLYTNHPTGTETGYAYLNKRTAIRGPEINGKRVYIENFYGLANKLNDVFRVLCLAKSYDIKNLSQLLILRLVQDLQNDELLEREILFFVCEFIQDMMLLHPFQHANTRTLVNLLLNEILIDIGLDPVVLRQPNVFDGFDPGELVLEIYEGQKLLKKIINQFDMYSEGLQNNCRALLAFTLRTDKPMLLDLALIDLNVPDFFKNKFIAAVTSFKNIEQTEYPFDLLHNPKFLEHFLRCYGNGPDAIFASTVILVLLLNDKSSSHLSWHLEFFIKRFFENGIEERDIVDGYFHSLAFITYSDDSPDSVSLLDALFQDNCSGNTLYKYSKNKPSIIFRCVDWYTNIKGLNKETKQSIEDWFANIKGSNKKTPKSGIDRLNDVLDAPVPLGARLSYEDRRKVDTRIESVFRHPRNRSFSI